MEGGCHCGAIRFKTTAEPYWIGACHCVDCRKISGAPCTVWVGFKEGQIEMLSGTPQAYASSKDVIRSFCEHCHAPMTFTYHLRPAEHFLPSGAFDDPAALAPHKHIWIEQKLPWVIVADDLPQERGDPEAGL